LRKVRVILDSVEAEVLRETSIRERTEIVLRGGATL
jgi:hypothetical protein